MKRAQFFQTIRQYAMLSRRKGVSYAAQVDAAAEAHIRWDKEHGTGDPTYEASIRRAVDTEYLPAYRSFRPADPDEV